MARKNNKTNILFRYGIITAGFLLFATAVVVKLFQTTVVDAGAWNERARRDFNRVDTLKPERGDILADNGNILACNLKVYDIKIDLRHDKVKKRRLNWASIDSLADSLDRYYPRRKNLLAQHPDTIKKYSWHAKLKREFEKEPNKRTRSLRFVKKGTLEDLRIIKSFPYLKDFKGKGFLNPVYTEERNVRIYPYGRMAYRSIGRVNENDKGEFHGYSGLEKDLDSLLYGKEGYAKKVTLTSGISNWVTQETQRGYNVQTTINIDLQDMLEQQLLEICRDARAEWGTAILMEVATGEIKAIANIENLDGEYVEALNRAVRGFEPGSVMKPISLMIAFEDGLVKSVYDQISCLPFQKTSDPHAPSVKNMKQVIEMSSNTGISRVIFRGYQQNPEKFYDRLASIGFFEPMHSGIAAENIPQMRRLTERDSRGNKITMTARHLDLARQAYGYNTTIPPLYTLAYYNAIANKGKLVRPHLMKRLIRDDVDSTLKIDYIREQVCSEETAQKVKECLKEPVWGEHGTARAVRDDRVMIAGKTGTAYPVNEHGGGYDKSRRRYAFAGFFPYDSPKYSCMALILAPSGTSANRTSGQVVKNMALKMYARGMLDNASTYTESQAQSTPVIAASRSQAQEIAKKTGAKNIKTIKTENPKHNISVKAMPNVMGFNAAEAVRVLESHGINVRLAGSGRVVTQSIPPGAQLRKGSIVTLSLKI